MKHKITVIAALDYNGLIGINNKLPWGYIQEDMEHFRKTTEGTICVCGKNTAKGLPSYLPNRELLVLTSDGIDGKLDLKALLEEISSKKPVMIIGGSNVYKQAFETDLVDEVILTVIKSEYEGDTYFPNWNKGDYQVDEIKYFEATFVRPALEITWYTRVNY